MKETRLGVSVTFGGCVNRGIRIIIAVAVSEKESVNDMFHNAKGTALPKHPHSSITNKSKNKMQSVLLPVYSVALGFALQSEEKNSH